VSIPIQLPDDLAERTFTLTVEPARARAPEEPLGDRVQPASRSPKKEEKSCITN
jgi:hypothetical protein